jgi:hypothetical protein
LLAAGLALDGADDALEDALGELDIGLPMLGAGGVAEVVIWLATDEVLGGGDVVPERGLVCRFDA